VQLSVAVGSVNEVTSHSAVTSANVAKSGTGANKSSTVIVTVSIQSLGSVLVEVYVVVAVAV